MSTGLGQDSILSSFHPDAPALFNVDTSLERVGQTISPTSIKISNIESRGIIAALLHAGRRAVLRFISPVIGVKDSARLQQATARGGSESVCADEAHVRQAGQT